MAHTSSEYFESISTSDLEAQRRGSPPKSNMDSYGKASVNVDLMLNTKRPACSRLGDHVVFSKRYPPKSNLDSYVKAPFIQELKPDTKKYTCSGLGDHAPHNKRSRRLLPTEDDGGDIFENLTVEDYVGGLSEWLGAVPGSESGALNSRATSPADDSISRNAILQNSNMMVCISS